MNITFPCPTCGRALYEYREGRFMCGAEDCEDGGHYALNDLLKGLFKWHSEFQSFTANIGTLGKAYVFPLHDQWHWAVGTKLVEMKSPYGAGEVALTSSDEARTACEREVIAYLKGKLAEAKGDTE